MSKNEDIQGFVNFLPIYDFSEFGGDKPILPDCKLILSNGEVIQSHVSILANGSEFFYSAFTSGMAEDVNREVNISFNPQNLFHSIIKYLYSGEISVEENQIMSLFAIAKYYGVSAIFKDVDQKLQEYITQDNIISLVQQCYENELITELDYLTPYIAKYLTCLDMNVLSDNLDLPTFCRILQFYNSAPNEKINFLVSFLGDYRCNEQDLISVKDLFDSNNSSDLAIFCILLDHYDGTPIEKMNFFTSFNGDHECNRQDYQQISKVFNINDPEVISAYQTLKPSWAPANLKK